MPTALKTIKTLLGDRLLIRPLAKPERRGTLYVPTSAAQKDKQTDVWWGTIEALGRDARFPDAYGLKVGDVVGIEAIGRQCEAIAGDDGEDHLWVAEEFLAARSTGRIEAFVANEPWRRDDVGIIPLGAYVLVRPEPEEEKRGGIHLPHNAREPQKVGEVLAVSPGEISGGMLSTLHVETGARVLYGRYSGTWVKADEDLLLIKAGGYDQGNVVAVLEPVKEAAHV